MSPAPSLLVRGLRGFLTGQVRELAVGDVLVVGRSRKADLSTRIALRDGDRPDRLELMRSEPFRAVSRRHVRIHFLHPGLVEIKNLSRNGTTLDGNRIDCVAVTDLHARPRVLAVGPQEQLELSIRTP